MNHFTNNTGYKSIGSQPVWLFRALKPPCEHPAGAYFTSLEKDHPTLAMRLRIPRTKLAFVFSFAGADGLKPIAGERGRYVYFSPADYPVDRPRQGGHGPTGL